MLISVLFFSQSGLIFCETIDLCADDCIIEKKLSLKAEGDEVTFEGNYINKFVVHKLIAFVILQKNIQWRQLNWLAHNWSKNLIYKFARTFYQLEISCSLQICLKIYCIQLRLQFSISVLCKSRFEVRVSIWIISLLTLWALDYDNSICSMMNTWIPSFSISSFMYSFSENGNVTLTRFPLRIPLAIHEHVSKIMSDKEHLFHPQKRVKRGSRAKRQISPGVYSCGHQVSWIEAEFSQK